MEIKENIEKLLNAKIRETYSYGLIKDNLISFDERRILGKYLLNFNLYKIRCWTEKNVGLSGMQIYHKDRINCKEEKTIDVIKNNNIGDEEEFILGSKEMINEITLWKDDSLRGLVVKTNKGREKAFGCIGKGQSIKIDEFEERNNYLVGISLNFDKIEGIISMSFYHINKFTFYITFYLGYFWLRIKLKKKEFKNNVEENIKNLNYSDKALYKSCCLPDNQFYAIFKYIFN